MPSAAGVIGTLRVNPYLVDINVNEFALSKNVLQTCNPNANKAGPGQLPVPGRPTIWITVGQGVVGWRDGAG